MSILLFSSCQEKNETTCDFFEPLVFSENEIQAQSCCNGEITETGYTVDTGELVYSHNTLNCGECGNICHNGCLCSFVNSQVDCECTGVK